MAYTPIPVRGLGAGLDLRAAAGAVGPATLIDGLDVDPVRRGRLQVRHGSSKVMGVAAGNGGTFGPPVCAAYTSSGKLVVGHASALARYSVPTTTAGASLALAAGIVRRNVIEAPGIIGGSLSDLLLFCDGSNLMTPWSNSLDFSGHTFTYRAAGASGGFGAGSAPKPRFAVLDPVTGRIYAFGFATTSGGPGGAASGVAANQATVFASMPGDALQWDADHFFNLRPGDAEEAMGAVAWRDRVFFFKQTAFWILGGTSVDSGGEPVFFRTPVDMGSGPIAPGLVCAGKDAVYFVARDGIYATTGGPPVRISDAIAPLFDEGVVPASYTGPKINWTWRNEMDLAYENGRLYFSFAAVGSGNAFPSHQLVLDVDTGQWYATSRAQSYLVKFPKYQIAGYLFISTIDGSGSIWGFYRDDRTRTQDFEDDVLAARTITGHAQFAFTDLGSPDVKTVAGVKVWGTGTYDVDIYRDTRDVRDAWATQQLALTDGIASEADAKIMRKAVRGTSFSLRARNMPAGATLAAFDYEALGVDASAVEKRD